MSSRILKSLRAHLKGRIKSVPCFSGSFSFVSLVQGIFSAIRAVKNGTALEKQRKTDDITAFEISFATDVSAGGFFMRFRCPFCFYAINADESARGYSMTCPSCAKTVMVPVGRFEDGCIIGDFLIKSKIGEGSIGAVYLATQLSLERQVALKILSPEYSTHKGINDFLNEARAAAKLSHINLVQSFAIGEEDNICYMAMTYITGETVRKRILREGRIPVDESLHIIQQVAEALYYAWEESRLIHRDVKPDNIMITEDGIVKLTDLGLAMQTSEWSKDMEISGSPSYMSPEQFSGEPLDTRSDIYSLGVTLYQMISGKLPFDAETVRSVAHQHFEEDAVPLNKVDTAVPVPVARLVRKMMAKKPADRYRDMEDLLNEIWTIRQKTAPDRSLVPEIHTISLKRLDYEMQHESSEAKKNVLKLEDEIRERRKYLRILLALIPVALILGIIVTLYWYGNTPINTSVETRIAQKTAYFKRFANDGSLPLKVIQEEGEKILAEFGKPRSRTQRFMLDNIRAIMTEAAYRRSQLENRNLLNSLRNARRDNAALKAEAESVTVRMKDPDNKAISAEETARTRKLYEENLKKLNALNATIKSLETERNALQERVSSLELTLEENWRDMIRAEIMKLRPQLRLREISALLAVESVQYPRRTGWLNEREQENLFLGRILLDIAESGTKYSAKELPGLGKIIMISSGFIDYQDRDGRVRQMKWNALPTDIAWQILSDNPLFTGKEREVRAGLELLKGNLGMAQMANPTDLEVNAMIRIYLQNTVRTMKYMVPDNRNGAKELYDTALKVLNGGLEFENMKNNLSAILSL